MGIALVGISYKEATSVERDLVAFTPSKRIEVLNALCNLEGIYEVVILSTCNRTEIYFVGEDLKINSQQVLTYLLDYFHVIQLKHLFYTKIGRSAIVHLLRVATGLDSQIIGEDQILGQLKDAHELAMHIGVSKKILNQTMTKAITFAKEMKTKYRITEYPLSVSSVAVRFAKEIIGSMEESKVLLIGAGSVGQLCLKALLAYGTRDIKMCNRTVCTLESVEQEFPIQVVPYEERYQWIPDMDLVISATSSPHLILKGERLPELHKPVVFLDLAMPLDIDKSIKNHENAIVYDLDDINHQTQQNLQLRQELASEIEGVIEKKANSMMQWIRQSKVDPLLATFQDLRRETQEDAMEIIKKKMQLSEKDYLFIEKMIESSLNRVMRDPILQLKKMDNDEDLEHYKKMIHRLFNIN